VGTLSEHYPLFSFPGSFSSVVASALFRGPPFFSHFFFFFLPHPPSFPYQGVGWEEDRDSWGSGLGGKRLFARRLFLPSLSPFFFRPRFFSRILPISDVRTEETRIRRLPLFPFFFFFFLFLRPFPPRPLRAEAGGKAESFHSPPLFFLL